MYLDRVIKDVVWGRRIGYVVESALSDGVANQNIQCYEINLRQPISGRPGQAMAGGYTSAVSYPLASY